MASEENYDKLFTFKGGDVDLTAIYKGKPASGKVFSQALGLASPVWKKLLVQPPHPAQYIGNGQPSSSDHVTPNSNPLTVKNVDFSTDNGEALLLLLRIAHLRFGDVPKDLHRSELFDLAVLCEKYECHDIIRPFSGGWINNCRLSATILDVTDEANVYLYIAWALGIPFVFSTVAMQVMKKLTISNLDRKPHLAKMGLDHLPMPEKIIESILDVRTKTIQQLLKLPYTYITRFIDGRSAICKLESASLESRGACDAIIYGSLLRQLGRHKLWPKNKAENVRCSVVDLAKNIRTLAPISLPKLLGAPEGEDHSACKGPTFEAEVRKILASVPSPVLDCHLKHMEMRSKPAVPGEDESMEEGGGSRSLKLVLKVPKDFKLRN